MNINQSCTYISDLDTSLSHVIGIEKLYNTSVLITGATGTIGSYLSDMLIRFDQKEHANLKLYLAGRDLEKLRGLYGSSENAQLVLYNMENPPEWNMDVDFIIHGAGNAYPAAFDQYPVETIMGNVNSTFHLLEFLKKKKGKRLLYVSSGEIYGRSDDAKRIFEENFSGYLDITSPRSCYPLSKRMTENLCVSYAKEYGLETVIVRPCHTYGPCITSSDNRAHAQFINNALAKKDIILKSAGMQLRSYNYVGDCAAALLSVLLQGNNGETYNLADPESVLTIAQLAKLVAETAGCRLVYGVPTTGDIMQRSPILNQVLDTKKIENLGWRPAFCVKEGISHTLTIRRELFYDGR